MTTRVQGRECRVIIKFMFLINLPIHCIVCQDGIPNDEIWVKIGGDKGGGSLIQNEFSNL